MWYFFVSGTEYLFALLGLGIIVWLIGAGLKSMGGKVFESAGEPLTEEEWQKMKEELGPMTWTSRKKERPFQLQPEGGGGRRPENDAGRLPDPGRRQAGHLPGPARQH